MPVSEPTGNRKDPLATTYLPNRALMPWTCEIKDTTGLDETKALMNVTYHTQANPVYSLETVAGAPEGERKKKEGKL